MFEVIGKAIKKHFLNIQLFIERRMVWPWLSVISIFLYLANMDTDLSDLKQNHIFAFRKMWIILVKLIWLHLTQNIKSPSSKTDFEDVRQLVKCSSFQKQHTSKIIFSRLLFPILSKIANKGKQLDLCLDHFSMFYKTLRIVFFKSTFC